MVRPAFREGRKAFYEDRYPDDCPYLDGDSDYDAWMEGWQVAYDEWIEIRVPQQEFPWPVLVFLGLVGVMAILVFLKYVGVL